MYNDRSEVSELNVRNIRTKFGDVWVRNFRTGKMADNAVLMKRG